MASDKPVSISGQPRGSELTILFLANDVMRWPESTTDAVIITSSYKERIYQTITVVDNSDGEFGTRVFDE